MVKIEKGVVDMPEERRGARDLKSFGRGSEVSGSRPLSELVEENKDQVAEMEAVDTAEKKGKLARLMDYFRKKEVPAEDTSNDEEIKAA